MDNEKIQELLLKLIEDMAYVKAKLDNIEEQKLSSRIDHLEAQNSDHEKSIRALEHRNDEMEKFVRGNLTDSKKQQTGVFISMGLAVFSALLSFVMNMLG